MIGIIIVVVILAVIALALVGIYNSLVQLRVRADNAWADIDVQLKRRLRRIITLDELRAHEGGRLLGMLLLRRGNRLSVTPVSAAHWQFILTLE